MVGNFNIDNITEIEQKKGKALRFNLMYHGDFNGARGCYIAIPGFRLMDGCIQAPCNRIQNKWFPVAYLSEDFAKGLYEALEFNLESKGLKESHPLAPVDVAIDPLVDTKKVAKYYPGMWKE